MTNSSARHREMRDEMGGEDGIHDLRMVYWRAAARLKIRGSKCAEQERIRQAARDSASDG